MQSCSSAGGHRCVANRTLASAQKKAEAEGRTVVWVDESGFYLLPGVVRTYAPRGQTPVLRVPLTRDHLSVISGITEAGRLFQMVQTAAYTSVDIVRFLRHLLRQIAGKLVVIWDGAPIHRSQVIKDFLASGAAARLHLERLPGYAPDLNPDEGIWQYLKHVELRNRCCRSLADLRNEFRLAIGRLRHKQHAIRGCISHCHYTL
jgi:transposase